MSRPISAAYTVGEESQDHDYDQHMFVWRNIEIDENKMVALRRVIEEICNSTDNLPDEMIEAAKAVSKISEGINATMISLYPT